MTPADLYRRLIESGQPPSGCTGFDAHIVAAIIALSVVEASAEQARVVDHLGLDPEEMVALVAEFFPAAQPVFAQLATGGPVERDETEILLVDLLTRTATDRSELQLRLARMIARRCLRPNHLWQDLGLRNRRELSWLMERHFESLAAKNAQDMKWKKFLYRTICRDADHSICPVPVCDDCDDFDQCFGEEKGTSVLAAG